MLSTGVMAAGHLQAHLRLASDIARQRAEAVRLGQEDLESLRAFSVMAASSAGLRSYDAIDAAANVFAAGGAYATPTRFEVRRDVDAAAFAGSKAMRVRVGWNDRRGQAQQVELASVIAAQDPVHSAALVLGAAAPALRGAQGRAVSIPVAAWHLGNGRSAFRPTPSAAFVLVFDNATGAVVERCAAPAAPTIAPAPTAPTACSAEAGRVVGGTVRFAVDTPTAGATPSDTPLPLTIAFTPTGGPYPAPATCTSEALMTVRFTTDDGPHVEPVPLGAAPASWGLAAWVETGDRYVAYQCVVHPDADGRWSGRTTIVPAGWTVGSNAGDRRVCRYSADLDGSGAVDAAFEHPVDYRAVDGSLANQNFLVLPATLGCPSAPGLPPDGAPTDAVGFAGTAAHQP